VDGVPVELNFQPNYLKSYTLPKGKHILDIRFQGLLFPNADQLKYSYQLVGLQTEWIDIGINRFVTFSGLAPGKYRFEVKAGSLNSNSKVKTLQIIVPTPIVQQGWFLLLCGMLITGLIYLIYQYRIRKIKNEAEEKMEMNKKIAELELKALRSQMNPHFMFNSLNSIKNFILRSEKKEAAEYLSNFAHLIRLILQNSREKKISLQDELETLMLYIELEQLRFDDEFEFHCQIGDGVQMEQTTIPPMILQPYVENAIWHGLMHKKGKGKLSLIFEKCNDKICIIIEDDGVGRDKALEMKEKSIRKYKSMGMGITQDRIHLMNQMNAFGISVDVHDLKIDSDGETGTRVTVKVPANGHMEGFGTSLSKT
jgi:two-component sensor histidine kinase